MIRSAIILLIVAALFGAGFGCGAVWSAHQHDAADKHALAGQLTATQQALDQSQADWQHAIQQFRDDSATLQAFAQEYGHDRDARTHYFGILNDRLDAALAAWPAGAVCDIGPDGLRIWNDANRGAPAAAGVAAAAADDRRGAVAAMPAAAVGQQRQGFGAEKKSSADHAALSRLRRSAQPNHRRGEKARSHRSGARGVSGTSAGASRLALIEATGVIQ